MALYVLKKTGNFHLRDHPKSTSTLRGREGTSQKGNLNHKMSRKGNPGGPKIGKMGRRQLWTVPLGVKEGGCDPTTTELLL